MTRYTVNVGLPDEPNSRLTFLALYNNTSRRNMAYDLLTNALAQTVIGNAEMRKKYDDWQSKQRLPGTDAGGTE